MIEGILRKVGVTDERCEVEVNEAAAIIRLDDLRGQPEIEAALVGMPIRYTIEHSSG